MAATFVILAAGIGRRSGRNKQLEAVGCGGATLMGYSIYDGHGRLARCDALAG
jgi:choline kinase